MAHPLRCAERDPIMSDFHAILIANVTDFQDSSLGVHGLALLHFTLSV